MDEVRAIRAETNPAETLLVVDAMTGQDAVNTARAFNEALGITGIVMTRMDGDARGGAALSMRAITGAPIKLTGVGEKLDALEDFHPERVAGRILGMGDIVGLVESAAETVDEEEAEKLAAKMMAGKFDLDDYAKQLKQITKMGSISSIVGMLPGMGQAKEALDNANLDKTVLVKQGAMISSMTMKERRMPDIIKASRKKRIAAGSGTTVQDVNKLLKQFDDMSTMMKKMRKLGQKGLMRHGLGAIMPKGMQGRQASSAVASPEPRHTGADRYGTEDQTSPRRRQEAPVLPHRGRRQPLAAGRPLHREARQLQPDAAGRACRAHPPAGRAHQPLAERGCTADRPGRQVPRPRRPGPDARVPRAADPVRTEEEGAGARQGSRRRLMPDERILLGVVGRPHGVRGLLHVHSYTADPAALASYGPLTDEPAASGPWPGAARAWPSCAMHPASPSPTAPRPSGW